MARRPQRRGNGQRAQRRVRDLDNEGIIPVLARAVREVEGAAQRGAVPPSARTKFQVVALLVREERARVKADTEASESQRAEQLKRLDGIATILAKTATRDTTLLHLLGIDPGKLVYEHNGRERKLIAEKPGRIVSEILA